MAKSNAERQAEYRARQREDGARQVLSTVVPFRTKNALTRLAACYGVTQREMLERIVEEAERRLLDRVGNRHADAYYDQKLRLEDGVTR